MFLGRVGVVFKCISLYSLIKSLELATAGFDVNQEYIKLVHCSENPAIPCSTKKCLMFFSNIIGLPEHKNKRKSDLEITKMYYF